MLLNFFKDKRGQTLVEGAFGAAICILAFLWMGEWCMCMYDQTILQDAAQEGVRFAIVHGQIAYQNSGHGSGPGTDDPSGQNTIARYVVAWFAQSALKSGIVNFAVCPAWWAPGTRINAFPPDACAKDKNGNVHASYSSSWTNASPGTVVTVQVSWQYQPYIRLPWIPPTLTYTAVGAVAY
jgi:hypothetical protein